MVSCPCLCRIKNALALLAFCTVCGVLHAAETTYPVRNIRLVVADASGGAADAVARVIAPKLSDAMGQAWFVDDRGGAAGNVAVEIAVRADPNGYTVLLATSAQLTFNPSLYDKLPFDIQRDLQPITMLANSEHIVVVNPNVPVKTLQEFVALAKQKPGVFNMASGGVGSTTQLAGELLKKRAGIDLVHVPYKGGALATQSLIAGETQVSVASILNITYVKDGRLRALATTGAKRSKLTPDIPTVAESGYPGFETGVWYALLVPSGTPSTVVERLGGEAHGALQRSDVQTILLNQGLIPMTSTSAELTNRIKTETAQWAGIIKELDIHGE